MRVSKIQSISLPSEMIELVESIAREEGMTKSELFLEALRQYLRKKQWEKVREYGAKKAAELNIKSDEDIEILIDEYRSGSR